MKPQNRKTLRVLFAAGGSGGPVAPLLAVAEAIVRDHPGADFVFIGTKNGPEGKMVSGHGWKFKHIVAGKFRRYFSWANLLTPFSVAVGLFQALVAIRKFKPGVIVGSGSFVQVPVIWAGWLLRVPALIHQQDIYPSLANSLCAPIAKRITVTFKDSLQDFPSGLGLYPQKYSVKTIHTGNPCRESIFLGDKKRALSLFHLDAAWPTLLILGGGTGAQALNRLVAEALPGLTRKVQIIHVTGRGKTAAEKDSRYHPYEFISEMGDAYAVADLVISRAGLSTITELSNLGKISMIIPMPNTHQEYNASELWYRRAAIVLDQNDLTPEGLVDVVTRLLFNNPIQQTLKKNISELMPKDSASKIAQEVIKIAK